METFRTAAAGRNSDGLTLECSEAAEMSSAGFRFAEFNPDGDQYRASVLCRIAQDIFKNTFTIEQH